MKHPLYTANIRPPRFPDDGQEYDPQRDPVPLYINRPLFTEDEIERALQQELAA